MSYSQRLIQYNRTLHYLWLRQWLVGRLSTHIPKLILDFGAGVGGLACPLSACNHVTAFEPSTELRQYGMRECPKVVWATRVPQLQFDVILCVNVLGHVLNPEATLTGLHSRLTPSGKAFFVIPRRLSWLARKPWNEVKGYKDDPTLLHIWSDRGFRRLLKGAGFTVRSTTACGEYRNVPFFSSWVMYEVSK